MWFPGEVREMLEASFVFMAAGTFLLLVGIVFLGLAFW